MLAMQGAHQVAQNSTPTTLPFRWAHSADAPSGALSSRSTDNGGAGWSGFGCALGGRREEGRSQQGHHRTNREAEGAIHTGQ